MAQTSKKSQELDIRTIMQGLEEFATFMSFQGNNSDMRILSVETVPSQHYSSDNNVMSPKQSRSRDYKSLSFSDRPTH